MQVAAECEARVFIGVDPESGSWSLDIQAEQPDGSWPHFARYAIRPR